MGQTAVTVRKLGVNTAVPRESIAIQKGDVIGFYHPQQSILPFDGRQCPTKALVFLYKPSASEMITNKTFNFTRKQVWNGCRNYSFQVTVSTKGESFACTAVLY